MSDIVKRLRGQYPVGPIGEDGEPEFGWRKFEGLPPIQSEAADEIERLRKERDGLRETLHEIDVLAGSIIPPDGAEAAHSALADILVMIRPHRKPLKDET